MSQSFMQGDDSATVGNLIKVIGVLISVMLVLIVISANIA